MTKSKTRRSLFSIKVIQLMLFILFISFIVFALSERHKNNVRQALYSRTLADYRIHTETFVANLYMTNFTGEKLNTKRIDILKFLCDECLGYNCISADERFTAENLALETKYIQLINNKLHTYNNIMTKEDLNDFRSYCVTVPAAFRIFDDVKFNKLIQD